MENYQIQFDQMIEIFKGLMNEFFVNEELNSNQDKTIIIDQPAKFYTIKDVAELTGFSVEKTRDLFNDPEFPCTNLGKSKVVEDAALKNYFSKRRDRNSTPYWRSVCKNS